MLNEEVKKMLSKLPEEINNYNIENNFQNEVAGNYLVTIKKLKKQINDTFDPVIKKAFEAHKEALLQKNKHLKPLDECEKLIKNKISAYLTECERLRKQEQLRLEEEARKRQEQEALQAAAIAESDEEANEIIQQAIDETPVVIAPKIETKVEGISSRQIARWKIIDPTKVNLQFLIIDDKKVNGVVRSMGKEAEGVVGGIQVYFETIISARG